MADEKAPKSDKKPKPEEEVVCTTKCYHGKLWNIGEKTTVRSLELMGGSPYPEKYFSLAGSTAAEEVSPKSQTKKEKLRTFLISKKITPPPKATIKQLQEMVDKFQARKTNNPLD